MPRGLVKASDRTRRKREVVCGGTLEAVSKLSKGDHHASDLEEGQEHLGLKLVSDHQPAKVSEPGHGPFGGPSAWVAA